MTSESQPGDQDGTGLVRTRRLVDMIAARMCDPLFGSVRAPNVRVKYGTVPRTARCIHHRVAAEVKRLLGQVPDEVLATQRAVFAATFGTKGADSPELYRPEYAMLRRDVRTYRAAAAALADRVFLAGQAARNAVQNSPEYQAAKVAAERAGLQLGVTPVLYPCEDAVRDEEIAALDRLASDWLGVFSSTGRPYRSLNRTLMNLPGGIPASLLRYLAGLPLPRPITDRVELLAALAWCEHAVSHRPGRQYMHLFLHADRAGITRAMETVSTATHVPLSPRRAADIARSVAYMCDYPDGHGGSIAGLARKSAAWHREAAGLKAAKAIEQLGAGRVTMLPPVPLPEVPGITFLDTVGRIAAEAAAMDNCVASYAAQAVEGWCYLFHAEHRGEVATVEVSPDGTVAQAEGPANKPNAAARWARGVLSKWGRLFPEGSSGPAADPWAAYPPLPGQGRGAAQAAADPWALASLRAPSPPRCALHTRCVKSSV